MVKKDELKKTIKGNALSAYETPLSLLTGLSEEKSVEPVVDATESVDNQPVVAEEETEHQAVVTSDTTPRQRGKYDITARDKTNTQSRRISLTVTPDLYDRMLAKAERLGISVNYYIRNAIRQDLDNE